MTAFLLHKNMYSDTFEVTAEMEEYGTGRQTKSRLFINEHSEFLMTCNLYANYHLGVILKGYGQTSFTCDIRTVTFEDVPEAYKPGIPFEGKVTRLILLSGHCTAGFMSFSSDPTVRWTCFSWSPRDSKTTLESGRCNIAFVTM